MRISDWSSDVCSSDLTAALTPRRVRWHGARISLGSPPSRLFLRLCGMELSHHPLPLHLSRLRDRGNRTMGGRGGDLAPAQSAVQSGHSDALPRAAFPLRCEGAATPDLPQIGRAHV